MTKSLHKKNTSHGFALAAVLWLMAGLSIVVALIADTTQASAERVAQLRERTDFVQSALSARANAQYWLSASRLRSSDFFDGAYSVRADNTPYKIDTKTTGKIGETLSAAESGFILGSQFGRALLQR